MTQDIKKKDLIIFGLIWALIFIVVGLYPLIYNEPTRLWLLIAASIFIAISAIKPSLLKVFYKIWAKIGEFIGNIISKIILFIMYFGLFTPISIVLKILRKDLLNKKINKNASTYWIARETQPQSMKNQF